MKFINVFLVTVLATSVQSAVRIDKNKCEHGGILNNVYLDNDSQSKTLHNNINSMEKCVEECCQIESCDLAMLKNNACYTVGCPNDNSCQFAHSEDANDSIAFITNRKEQSTNISLTPKKQSSKNITSLPNNEKTVKQGKTSSQKNSRLSFQNKKVAKAQNSVASNRNDKLKVPVRLEINEKGIAGAVHPGSYDDYGDVDDDEDSSADGDDDSGSTTNVGNDEINFSMNNSDKKKSNQNQGHSEDVSDDLEDENKGSEQSEGSTKVAQKVAQNHNDKISKQKNMAFKGPISGLVNTNMSNTNTMYKQQSPAFQTISTSQQRYTEEPLPHQQNATSISYQVTTNQQATKYQVNRSGRKQQLSKNQTKAPNKDNADLMGIEHTENEKNKDESHKGSKTPIKLKIDSDNNVQGQREKSEEDKNEENSQLIQNDEKIDDDGDDDNDDEEQNSLFESSQIVRNNAFAQNSTYNISKQLSNKQALKKAPSKIQTDFDQSESTVALDQLKTGSKINSLSTSGLDQLKPHTNKNPPIASLDQLATKGQKKLQEDSGMGQLKRPSNKINPSKLVHGQVTSNTEANQLQSKNVPKTNLSINKEPSQDLMHSALGGSLKAASSLKTTEGKTPSTPNIRKIPLKQVPAKSGSNLFPLKQEANKTPSAKTPSVNPSKAVSNKTLNSSSTSNKNPPKAISGQTSPQEAGKNPSKAVPTQTETNKNPSKAVSKQAQSSDSVLKPNPMNILTKNAAGNNGNPQNSFASQLYNELTKSNPSTLNKGNDQLSNKPNIFSSNAASKIEGGKTEQVSTTSLPTTTGLTTVIKDRQNAVSVQMMRPTASTSYSTKLKMNFPLKQDSHVANKAGHFNDINNVNYQDNDEDGEDDDGNEGGNETPAGTYQIEPSPKFQPDEAEDLEEDNSGDNETSGEDNQHNQTELNPNLKFNSMVATTSATQVIKKPSNSSLQYPKPFDQVNQENLQQLPIKNQQATPVVRKVSFLQQTQFNAPMFRQNTQQNQSLSTVPQPGISKGKVFTIDEATNEDNEDEESGQSEGTDTESGQSDDIDTESGQSEDIDTVSGQTEDIDTESGQSERKGIESGQSENTHIEKGQAKGIVEQRIPSKELKEKKTTQLASRNPELSSASIKVNSSSLEDPVVKTSKATVKMNVSMLEDLPQKSEESIEASVQSTKASSADGSSMDMLYLNTYFSGENEGKGVNQSTKAKLSANEANKVANKSYTKKVPSISHNQSDSIKVGGNNLKGQQLNSSSLHVTKIEKGSMDGEDDEGDNEDEEGESGNESSGTKSAGRVTQNSTSALQKHKDYSNRTVNIVHHIATKINTKDELKQLNRFLSSEIMSLRKIEESENKVINEKGMGLTKGIQSTHAKVEDEIGEDTINRIWNITQNINKANTESSHNNAPGAQAQTNAIVSQSAVPPAGMGKPNLYTAQKVHPVKMGSEESLPPVGRNKPRVNKNMWHSLNKANWPNNSTLELSSSNIHDNQPPAGMGKPHVYKAILHGDKGASNIQIQPKQSKFSHKENRMSMELQPPAGMGKPPMYWQTGNKNRNESEEDSSDDGEENAAIHTKHEVSPGSGSGENDDQSGSGEASAESTSASSHSTVMMTKKNETEKTDYENVSVNQSYDNDVATNPFQNATEDSIVNPSSEVKNDNGDLDENASFNKYGIEDEEEGVMNFNRNFDNFPRTNATDFEDSLKAEFKKANGKSEVLGEPIRKIKDAKIENMGELTEVLAALKVDNSLPEEVSAKNNSFTQSVTKQIITRPTSSHQSMENLLDEIGNKRDRLERRRKLLIDDGSEYPDGETMSLLKQNNDLILRDVKTSERRSKIPTSGNHTDIPVKKTVLPGFSDPVNPKKRFTVNFDGTISPDPEDQFFNKEDSLEKGLYAKDLMSYPANNENDDILEEAENEMQSDYDAYSEQNNDGTESGIKKGEISEDENAEDRTMYQETGDDQFFSMNNNMMENDESDLQSETKKDDEDEAVDEDKESEKIISEIKKKSEKKKKLEKAINNDQHHKSSTVKNKATYESDSLKIKQQQKSKEDHDSYPNSRTNEEDSELEEDFDRINSEIPQSTSPKKNNDSPEPFRKLSAQEVNTKEFDAQESTQTQKLQVFQDFGRQNEEPPENEGFEEDSENDEDQLPRKVNKHKTGSYNSPNEKVHKTVSKNRYLSNQNKTPAPKLPGPQPSQNRQKQIKSSTEESDSEEDLESDEDQIPTEANKQKTGLYNYQNGKKQTPKVLKNKNSLNQNNTPDPKIPESQTSQNLRKQTEPSKESYSEEQLEKDEDQLSTEANKQKTGSYISSSLNVKEQKTVPAPKIPGPQPSQNLEKQIESATEESNAEDLEKDEDQLPTEANKQKSGSHIYNSPSAKEPKTVSSNINSLNQNKIPAPKIPGPQSSQNLGKQVESSTEESDYEENLENDEDQLPTEANIYNSPYAKGQNTVSENNNLLNQNKSPAPKMQGPRPIQNFEKQVESSTEEQDAEDFENDEDQLPTKTNNQKIGSYTYNSQYAKGQKTVSKNKNSLSQNKFPDPKIPGPQPSQNLEKQIKSSTEESDSKEDLENDEDQLQTEANKQKSGSNIYNSPSAKEQKTVSEKKLLLKQNTNQASKQQKPSVDQELGKDKQPSEVKPKFQSELKNYQNQLSKEGNKQKIDNVGAKIYRNQADQPSKQSVKINNEGVPHSNKYLPEPEPILNENGNSNLNQPTQLPQSLKNNAKMQIFDKTQQMTFQSQQRIFEELSPKTQQKQSTQSLQADVSNKQTSATKTKLLNQKQAGLMVPTTSVREKNVQSMTNTFSNIEGEDEGSTEDNTDIRESGETIESSGADVGSGSGEEEASGSGNSSGDTDTDNRRESVTGSGGSGSGLETDESQNESGDKESSEETNEQFKSEKENSTLSISMFADKANNKTLYAMTEQRIPNQVYSQSNQIKPSENKPKGPLKISPLMTYLSSDRQAKLIFHPNTGMINNVSTVIKQQRMDPTFGKVDNSTIAKNKTERKANHNNVSTITDFVKQAYENAISIKRNTDFLTNNSESNVKIVPIKKNEGDISMIESNKMKISNFTIQKQKPLINVNLENQTTLSDKVQNKTKTPKKGFLFAIQVDNDSGAKDELSPPTDDIPAITDQNQSMLYLYPKQNKTSNYFNTTKGFTFRKEENETSQKQRGLTNEDNKQMEKSEEKQKSTPLFHNSHGKVKKITKYLKKSKKTAPKKSKPATKHGQMKVQIYNMKKTKHGQKQHNAFPLLAKNLLKHAIQFHKKGEESFLKELINYFDLVDAEAPKRKSHFGHDSVPIDKHKIKKWRSQGWPKKKHNHRKSNKHKHRDVRRKSKAHQRQIGQMDHHKQILNQQHGHPMNGHRFGGEDYQHTHKMANHDFSKQTGHYGMHNDTSDNHANNDRFADVSPDITDDQQPNQQYIENSDQDGLLGKIDKFNTLAGRLTNNLQSFNRGKGWKPIKDPDWKPFVEGQDRLENLKVARKSALENLHDNNKNDQTCHRGLTLRGATLRGGILSGEFKSVGVVETQKQCVDMCCKSKNCDIAMTVGRECINIKCFNRKNCNVAPAGSQSLYRNVLPITTFVQHSDQLSRRSEIPHPFTVTDVIKQLEDSEMEEIEGLINAVNTYP